MNKDLKYSDTSLNKMKVLWFEVTPPSKYSNTNNFVAGWQDSLERIVRSYPGIELIVAFETNNKDDSIKVIDGVKYVPVYVSFSMVEKVKDKLTWEIRATKLEKLMQDIVSDINPDIIHVFGVEWPYGRIAKYTKIPVVVHIMGALIPYENALYPPGYSYIDTLKNIPLWDIKSKLSKVLYDRKYKTWVASERQVWKSVKYYMGRTLWDKSLSSILHPNCHYYHVEEALRDSFVSSVQCWKYESRSKVRLFSVGCSSFWKGPDMLLKTAKLLKDSGLDFEWIVAGGMHSEIKRLVERKTGTTYEDNNVQFVGFISPHEIINYIYSSTLFVHTAYIENSPNAICEAQYLGIPIVSTNVGGISTLLNNGELGILVPANDPWQMAHSIIELANDVDRMAAYSKKSIAYARERHNDENILKQLLLCYSDILDKK